MKIVRDSAVRQEPAQPQAVSPEENRFSIRPRQIALFFLWMLAFTLLARGTSGALLPEVQLSTPAPNTITQSLTATGTIQWAAGSLFYLLSDSGVECCNISGERQWSQTLAAKPQALLADAKELLLFSGNTAQVLEPPQE